MKVEVCICDNCKSTLRTCREKLPISVPLHDKESSCYLVTLCDFCVRYFTLKYLDDHFREKRQLPFDHKDPGSKLHQLTTEEDK